MKMSIRFPVAFVAALCIVLVSTAGPASAHASLVSSDPEEGASLDSEPSTVSITFNEDVSTPAQLQVTAPDGQELADGEPTVDGASVSQTLQSSGYAGTYTIAYRVVSADGHPVTGELTYDVKSGKQAEQSAPDDEESFAQRHRTHLLMGAGAVVVAVVLLAWPWIRRRV
ncbi:MAG TPA: copper resistance CopC family protein [Nocardioidaceae bacterium]|nr:copper resistance CopC family protein [Nocardioidaceae bacterium]